MSNDISARLEYLRTQIDAECISYGEIAELQGLAEHIHPSDVQLLEWAGVPEFPEEEGEEDASLQMQTRVVIDIADGEVTGVTGLPPNSVVIVRDWNKGSEPDANGDIYEDTILEGGVG